jgi:hypothetical protein
MNGPASIAFPTCLDRSAATGTDRSDHVVVQTFWTVYPVRLRSSSDEAASAIV